MGRFWEAAAGVMVAVILWIVVSKQGKEFSLGLSLVACCLALMLVSSYLDPVFDLITRLEQLGGIQQEWINVMLKAVGIGMIVEIGSLICADAGNTALGKTFQFAAGTIVLWQSLPLFTTLIGIIEDILLLI